MLVCTNFEKRAVELDCNDTDINGKDHGIRFSRAPFCVMKVLKDLGYFTRYAIPIGSATRQKNVMDR